MKLIDESLSKEWKIDDIKQIRDMMSDIVNYAKEDKWLTTVLRRYINMHGDSIEEKNTIKLED